MIKMRMWILLMINYLILNCKNKTKPKSKIKYIDYKIIINIYYLYYVDCVDGTSTGFFL